MYFHYTRCVMVRNKILLHTITQCVEVPDDQCANESQKQNQCGNKSQKQNDLDKKERTSLPRNLNLSWSKAFKFNAALGNPILRASIVSAFYHFESRNHIFFPKKTNLFPGSLGNSSFFLICPTFSLSA